MHTIMTKFRSTAVLTAGVLLAVLSAAPRIAGQAPQPAAPAVQQVDLTSNRSKVITTDFDVTRIAITNPAIADAVVVQPREILIDGKAPGTVSLIVWGADQRIQYDVVVNGGVNVLEQQLRGLFPGEDINVTVNEEALTLSGHVSSNTVMLKAGQIAAMTSSKLRVINLLQVPGGIESQQVLLQVRFAEVNRQAVSELGVSLFTGQAKQNTVRVTTEQFSDSPNYQPDGTLTFSDYLNFFLFNRKYDVGGLLKALQTKGLLQSLAEPNLIAYNGQEASFLAGGEVPVPVVSGNTGTVSVTYKEFGIRLNFTPTIAGDMIRLHVRPEVSALDFANGVTLSGFRIPALTTRRAETEVELRDGQSFAVAGLMNNISQDTQQQIPFISSLPIIGNLFKSRGTNRSQTELMVLVTPRLVRPLDPDEVPALPTMDENFLPAPGATPGTDGPTATDAPPVRQ
jgi:pilus assembly protein CpaC